RGLTTAASIWAVAAIGLASGAGLYVPAGIATVFVLIVLFLSRLEERMELKSHGYNLVIRTDPSRRDAVTEDARNIIEAYGGKVKRVTSEVDETGEITEVVFDILLPRAYQKDVLTDISELPGAERTRWKK
ncbi:MAG: MgtC/SapB family protein, partial [Candidatus Omnitrophota bacterium]